ncbi:peptidoglycan-binding protein [Streptomyces sp. NPDC023723]|uniref:peptidoglycan-binding protein n=1 Tax=Streptomyces sp. NPDC023723 TaxID=3154323 RepID=UPI0033E9E36D
METPVFEEIDPANDCDCPGCRHWRRVLPHATATPAHPAARRALVVAATASAALATGAATALPAAAHAPQHPGGPAADRTEAPDGTSTPDRTDTPDTPDTPQGKRAPLHGPGGTPAVPPAGAPLPETTREQIMARAQTWVDAKVPYSMSAYWSDGYRQDCSGYVSMAWGLPANEWTGSLGTFSDRVTKDELQPGDVLLFHNTADPEKGSHVVIFGGWTDSTHTEYVAYEQTPPHTRRKATPYAYWNNSASYLPYRYKGVVASAAGAEPAAYPGTAAFGPGAHNASVTRLGRLLARRGAARYYATGPGPRWSAADRAATRAFQQAQGWRGADADGLPGPATWRLLVSGTGKDVPATGPVQAGVPGYPGRAAFRPGASGDDVTRLGRQLVAKGYGRFYAAGPGPRWGVADRRAVEAFQRAQGWRGGAADGFPGPETWRRLFS